jgi:glutathione S-transferase
MSYQYKLTYFNLRGLAETSRILFYLSGKDYEDFRYPIEIGEAFLKPEYDNDKSVGLFEVGMDRVPILTVTDEDSNQTFQLGQSKTIERYLAKQFGFMGKTAVEEARIDMICEHVRDIKQKYSDAKAKQKGDEFLQGEMSVWLSKLEKLVESDMYAVGNQISLADVTIQQFLCDYFDKKELLSEATQNAPQLMGIADFLSNVIQDWLTQRPVTPF